MPSAACAVTTTGRAIAIASSTLFWMPRAIRKGATAHAACARYGRTSGTLPVTTTPGWRASARTASVGRLPTMVNCAAGTASRTAGKTRSANQLTASTFGQ